MHGAASTAASALSCATCTLYAELLSPLLIPCCRVLRPGGRFLCLEFSKVVVPGMQQLYDLYSFNVIPQIGRWVVLAGFVFVVAEGGKPAALSTSSSRSAGGQG